MNLFAYLRLELARAVRNIFQILFSILLPAFMFIVFGGTQDYKDVPVHDGNIAATIMIGMALYGAVVNSTSIAASSAVEMSHGWGRQLRLTALRPGQYALVKALTCLCLAALPVATVFILGAFMGSKMPLSQWAATAFLAWILSTVFSLYGLAIGMTFSSEAAPGIASGSLVLWAFLGNLFAPLSGTLLDIGRLTPLYGIRGLAAYPVTRGDIPNGATMGNDPLWALILNTVAWVIILGALAAAAFRRRAGRR
ncbi:ABC transporter permease [Falsarthrobacter nasiphocae]|uniref:ABC-2 type transport system permease protein n=1 Tax=Falsarthrobacter nasiphocae TaxID=189863 RepID=A0AAE3YE61_9MICC|nr:ABC transporter permease [Falsarthrobacter nasiphocae]MDR6891555.1 ABC-2 type transport system permease protein [Falsarthrobacter nasiphocae]